MLKFSAYLIPKLKIEYINKNKKVNKVYCSKTGLSGYLDKKVDTLNSEQLTTAFHFDSKFCSCHFEFVKSDDSLIETYVNGARTLEDGNHLVGFKKVLHTIVQERANKKDSDFKPDDIIDGLVLVLNVNIPDAKFQSQVKDKLTTRDAIDWVYDALYKDLKKWGSSNASAIKEIIVRANLSRKAKLDWEQTRKAVLAVKGKRGKTSLPSSRKFAVSTGKDISKRELYVVEGDSAASSCRSARDPKYQEILALRGKILNAEKDKGSKLYQSQEVINILQAIGISADGNKYRVGKIVITSDADPDGCLDGNTRILTLNGKNPKIKTLVKQYKRDKKPIEVYSVDKDGNLVVGKAIKPRVTRTVDKMIKLTFDNGSSILCTLNHKWLINNPSKKDDRVIWKDGLGYIQAKDLTENDDVISINVSKNVLISHIAKKEIINSEQEVYCMTVPEYGNFMVADKEGNGICSSNSHIDCLVLTLLYKLAPDLFKKGMVYRLDAPLFIGKTDTKNYYADSLNSLKKMAKSFKTITRAKGLGELDADLLRDICFKLLMSFDHTVILV